MKKIRFLMLSCASLLVLGGLASLAHRNKIEEGDNITYDTPVVSRLDQPDFKMDDEEEETVVVKKVILHYHDDEGSCGRDTTTPGTAGGRSFYIWVNGVKGIECFPDEVTNEGQDMKLTVDFETEKFEKFGGKSALLFIIKYRRVDDRNENWGGQSSDTELPYSQFEPDKNGTVEVWTMHSSGSDIAIYKTEAETKVNGIKTAYFTSWSTAKNWKTIHCINTAEAGVTYSLYGYDETYYKIDPKERDMYQRFYLIKEGEASGSEFDIVLPYNAHINIVYTLESLDKESTTGLVKKTVVTYDKLYNDQRFETNYTYNGNDLGMTYNKEDNTYTFKVWAPTAGNMSLYLYDVGATSDFGGNNKYEGFHMYYTGHGIWEKTISGDVEGKFYTYYVDNTAGSFETMDPYATACGINGLRGYVYHKEDTNPEGWDELPLVWNNKQGYDISSLQDLTIYEVQVQDFTGDESWNGTEGTNGTFNAFVEKGTHLKDHPSITTGYDHLNELGIKAVQLLPVFDHDNDEFDKTSYNWGYNPLNYNCVEGVYSSDPSDPLARIREFKNLILQMSKTKAHTRVIMDVVYNHVSRASASSFTRLMPKYYFRFNDVTGEYEDGSGCSNEVRSEATMMRKFIVDSVKMWATEYKIKGFRFDLMGLIDVETMRLVKEALYAIDPDNVVYGEGWTSIAGYHGKGVAGASTANLGELYDKPTSHGFVGGFNDAGRDALRGGNDGGWGSDTALPTGGVLQGGSDEQLYKVGMMMWGINTNGLWNPKQNINYASCHDNWTVFDQLYWTMGSNGVAPDYSLCMDVSVVGHSIIMASNGAGFMLGGEELFRSKELKTAEEREEVSSSTYENMYGRYISHNSYNAPLSVNTFKWDNKYSAYGVDTTGYLAKFKEAIALHHSMNKFPYADPFPYAKTSAGEDIGGVSWKGSSNATGGLQLDEYFVFFAGRWSGWVESDARTWTKLYEFGTWKHGDYGTSVDVGDLSTSRGGAIVIFKRK